MSLVTPQPPATQALLDWLASQQPAMEALLAQTVNTDSGSGHEAGVRQVAALLRGRLEAASHVTDPTALIQGVSP